MAYDWSHFNNLFIVSQSVASFYFSLFSFIFPSLLHSLFIFIFPFPLLSLAVGCKHFFIQFAQYPWWLNVLCAAAKEWRSRRGEKFTQRFEKKLQCGLKLKEFKVRIQKCFAKRKKKKQTKKEWTNTCNSHSAAKLFCEIKCKVVEWIAVNGRGGGEENEISKFIAWLLDHS